MARVVSLRTISRAARRVLQVQCVRNHVTGLLPRVVSVRTDDVCITTGRLAFQADGAVVLEKGLSLCLL